MVTKHYKRLTLKMLLVLSFSLFSLNGKVSNKLKLLTNSRSNSITSKMSTVKLQTSCRRSLNVRCMSFVDLLPFFFLLPILPTTCRQVLKIIRRSVANQSENCLSPTLGKTKKKKVFPGPV